MKIQGIIIDPAHVRYNYRAVGYTRANGYMHDDQNVTRILIDNGTILTRWNPIPRKYVISDRATFMIARKERYYKQFSEWIAIGKNPPRNRMRSCMYNVSDFAQIGEEVKFEGKLEGNKIKGSIRAKAPKGLK